MMSLFVALYSDRKLLFLRTSAFFMGSYFLSTAIYPAAAILSWPFGLTMAGSFAAFSILDKIGGISQKISQFFTEKKESMENKERFEANKAKIKVRKLEVKAQKLKAREAKAFRERVQEEMALSNLAQEKKDKRKAKEKAKQAKRNAALEKEAAEALAKVRDSKPNMDLLTAIHVLDVPAIERALAQTSVAQLNSCAHFDSHRVFSFIDGFDRYNERYKVSALHLACADQTNPEISEKIIRLLLRNGSDVKLGMTRQNKDNYGGVKQLLKPPIDFALQTFNVEAIKAFVEEVPGCASHILLKNDKPYYPIVALIDFVFKRHEIDSKTLEKIKACFQLLLENGARLDAVITGRDVFDRTVEKYILQPNGGRKVATIIDTLQLLADDEDSLLEEIENKNDLSQEDFQQILAACIEAQSVYFDKVMQNECDYGPYVKSLNKTLSEKGFDAALKEAEKMAKSGAPDVYYHFGADLENLQQLTPQKVDTLLAAYQDRRNPAFYQKFIYCMVNYHYIASINLLSEQADGIEGETNGETQDKIMAHQQRAICILLKGMRRATSVPSEQELAALERNEGLLEIMVSRFAGLDCGVALDIPGSVGREEWLSYALQEYCELKKQQLGKALDSQAVIALDDEMQHDVDNGLNRLNGKNLLHNFQSGGEPSGVLNGSQSGEQNDLAEKNLREDVVMQKTKNKTLTP